MTWLNRLFAFLDLGREAPADSTAQAPSIPAPVPGVYHPAQVVPVYGVGEVPPAPANTSIPKEAPVATTDRFARLMEGVLGREGGYSNNPADKGGETMWGVTIARARAAGYLGPMRAMSREQAIEIYRFYYWRQPGFDRIDEIDAGLGERLFDAGINCGTSRAGQWLQRALNVLNGQGSLYADITVDGQCGAMTRAALQSFIQRRGAEGRAVLLEAVKSLQAGHYLSLAEGSPSQETFVYGWIRSRILGMA